MPNAQPETGPKERKRIRARALWAVWGLVFAVILLLVWLRPREGENAVPGPAPSRNPPASAANQIARPATTVESQNSQSEKIISKNPRAEEEEIGQLKAKLLSASLPLKDRRQAARSLARIGSDEAISALKLALSDGPPHLKAA